MIVRYEADGTVIMITQSDHALASGLFAAHWGNDTFERPKPYNSLVRAAMFHDRGWIRYETGPVLDAQGKTPSYRQVPNTPEQLQAFEWAGDWLGEIDPYAGLMVARHRTGLWQGRYGAITNPPAIQRGELPPHIKAFISRNEDKQKPIASKFDAKELAINYSLLQAWDMISLYICQNETLTPDIIDPVPTDYVGKGVAMTLTPLGADTVALDPYPFDTPTLTTNIVHRRLTQNAFKDQTELQDVYFRTAPQTMPFTFVPK